MFQTTLGALGDASSVLAPSKPLRLGGRLNPNKFAIPNKLFRGSGPCPGVYEGLGLINTVGIRCLV